MKLDFINILVCMIVGLTCYWLGFYHGQKVFGVKKFIDIVLFFIEKPKR